MGKKCRVWYKNECGKYATECFAMFAIGYVYGKNGLDCLADCVVEYEDGERLSVVGFISKHSPKLTNSHE